MTHLPDAMIWSAGGEGGEGGAGGSSTAGESGIAGGVASGADSVGGVDFSLGVTGVGGVSSALVAVVGVWAATLVDGLEVDGLETDATTCCGCCVTAPSPVVSSWVSSGIEWSSTPQDVQEIQMEIKTAIVLVFMFPP